MKNVYGFIQKGNELFDNVIDVDFGVNNVGIYFLICDVYKVWLR